MKGAKLAGLEIEVPIWSRDKAQYSVEDLRSRSIRSWRKMLNYCINFNVKGGRVLAD